MLAQIASFPLHLLHTLQLAELPEPDASATGLLAAEQDVVLSEDEQEATLSEAEETLLSETEQEAAPQLQFIDQLPLDILEDIFSFLDLHSTVAFSSTSSLTNTFYKKHVIKKFLLPLLDKPIHTPSERDALVKVYPHLLSFFLKDMIEGENDIDKLKSNAALVEKFLSFLTKPEIQSSLSQALRLNPRPYAQQGFERLAAINLPLAISLMTKVSMVTFVELGLNYDFLQAEIPFDERHIQDFLESLESSAENSALHFAMHYTAHEPERFRDMIPILLGNSPSSINLTDSRGDTLLIKASQAFEPNLLDNIQSLLDIVENLIEYEADINIQNNQGYTALMYAVTFRHVGLVELLLQHGADKTLTNNQGQTALELAQEKFPEIIPLLQNT